MKRIDIDEEQFIKTKNSRKCCQFIHARALNAIYALTDEGKPSPKEIKEDIEILWDANLRIIEEIDEANIVLSDALENEIERLRQILTMKIEELGFDGFTVLELLKLYKDLRKISGYKINLALDDNKFNIGDKVWHFFGNVLVECLIQGLDSCGLYYEIDEPTGHAISDDELYSSKEEIIEQAKNFIGSIQTLYKDNKAINEFDGDLNETRLERINSIKETNNKAQYSEEERKTWSEEWQDHYIKMQKLNEEWGLHHYKNKERFKEWFSIADLAKGIV